MSSEIDQIVIFNDVLLLSQFFKCISSNGSEKLSFEDQIFQIENIVRISLVNVRIRAIDTNCMQFTNLSYLNLSFNRISDVGSISHLVSLKSLDVSHNKIFDLSPIKKMISLEILRIESNLIECIKPIFNLVNLKQLLMSDNKVIWEELVYLENLNNLEIINLGKNPLEKKLKLFDFLCAFTPSLKSISGTNPNSMSSVNKLYKYSNEKDKGNNTDKENKITIADNSIDNDCTPQRDLNDDYANSRKQDFFRTSDGKLMITRARAYFIKNDDKTELKNDNKGEKIGKISPPTDDCIFIESLGKSSSGPVHTLPSNKLQLSALSISKNGKKRASLSCGNSRDERADSQQSLDNFTEIELLSAVKQKRFSLSEKLFFEVDHRNVSKSSSNNGTEYSLSGEYSSSASVLDVTGSTIRFGGDNFDQNAPIAFSSTSPENGYVR